MSYEPLRPLRKLGRARAALSVGSGTALTGLRRKLVIVGDGACGKTSLLSVFSLGEFPSEYEPTIFENYVAEIRLDGKPVQLALWDTAYVTFFSHRLRPLSYSKSHVILIAFSLDTPDSLENVSVKWIEEVRELCGPNIPVLLVGCKKDLRDQALAQGAGGAAGAGGRWVTTEQTDWGASNSRLLVQGQAMAQSIGARSYKECSALLNEGVDDLFEAATRAAMLVRGSGGESDGHHHHGSEKADQRRKSGEAGRKGNRKDDDGAGCCACVVC
ncbi:SPOSA6832_04369 [Sporobolomyces salmonicolor]|uniref:SPOSA6832_04369-mRNA-1:cds n=1 Tax=Sporidiobolus salmonicolor TaxID=5005 RepID=A0A0D6ERE5_SPOSA|nr:SPOSA6832_04369 [Sporobolomyces salmonicolor]